MGACMAAVAIGYTNLKGKLSVQNAYQKALLTMI